MSPYNYCANNPVILVDPDGRDIDTDFKDKKGNIIMHVEDGSNAVFQLTGTNQTNEYFSFVGFSDQGGKNVINIKGLIAGAQNYVLNNYIHCNQAVNFVGRTYNSILLRTGYNIFGGTAIHYNNMANKIGSMLNVPEISSYPNDSQGREEAIKAAQAGYLVVGYASGHVTTLTSDNFIITVYNSNGKSTTVNYQKGTIVNVNGSTNQGLGPRKNNTYQNDPRYALVNKFFVIKPFKRAFRLPEVQITN
jgi:hypothetical protein